MTDKQNKEYQTVILAGLLHDVMENQSSSIARRYF